MKKILLISFLFLFLFLFNIYNVSALGLNIINQSSFNVNKIYNNQEYITFQLTNTQSFPIYNISVYNSTLITFPQIAVLNNGQTANITATINTNTPLTNQVIKIKGFYQSQIGASNTTYDIDVSYSQGLSVCDKSIIKGDKITWHNLVSDEIVLRNADTSNDVTTILMNNNYTSNFDTATIFRYYFLRRGFVFTPVCTITSLPDQGLVNNPDYDASINLTLNIIFNPTTLNYNIPERNYTINYYYSQDGVLTLTNNGSEIARNIRLSGDWFTFNNNNFDLSPGQTRGIVYTIKPYLTRSEDTNKIYNKQLTIEGNFRTINESFNIFIPYINLNASNNQSNYNSLISIIQDFCRTNPSMSFCQNSTQVVYIGNNSNQEFNVSMKQEQFTNLIEYLFTLGDNQQVLDNYVKEKMSELKTQQDLSNNQTQESLNTIKLLKASTEENSNYTTYILLFITFLLISSLLVLLIYNTRNINKNKEVLVWQSKQ